MQPQAVFVVFGQAGGLEDEVVIGYRELLDCIASVSGADSVGRNEASEHGARRHVLELPLGELVAIDAMNELAQGGGQRQHGNLDHVVVVRIGVDLRQSFGMNQVFGIVRDDDFESSAMIFLVQQHALVDPVETVGL